MQLSDLINNISASAVERERFKVRPDAKRFKPDSQSYLNFIIQRIPEASSIRSNRPRCFQQRKSFHEKYEAVSPVVENAKRPMTKKITVCRREREGAEEEREGERASEKESFLSKFLLNIRLVAIFLPE